MKAVCYQGVNRLAAETVAEPKILQPRDAIVKVRRSTTCGSDLPLIGGMVPTVRRGDIIGHECMGEIVETGSAVRHLPRGARVVVSPVLGCGACFFCRNEMWSLCDNTNPNDALDEMLGCTPAGMIGYSHALGGFAGCHAEYVRVPFADHGLFPIPDAVSDDQAVFASDALPTGYMAADNCNLHPGDTIAVWGCGGVGLMAMLSARAMGAQRILAIDQWPERLDLARDRCGAEVIDFRKTDVLEALREMTGGRGPDACIDAVGMDAAGGGISHLYDRVKHKVGMAERAGALGDAIMACRKGATLSVAGAYLGFVDRFPIGAVMNKGLTIRTGRLFAQKYIPRLLEMISSEKLDPSFLITHRMSLDEAQEAYDMFRTKDDGCVRAVFAPQ